MQHAARQELAARTSAPMNIPVRHGDVYASWRGAEHVYPSPSTPAYSPVDASWAGTKKKRVRFSEGPPQTSNGRPWERSSITAHHIRAAKASLKAGRAAKEERGACLHSKYARDAALIADPRLRAFFPSFETWCSIRMVVSRTLTDWESRPGGPPPEGDYMTKTIGPLLVVRAQRAGFPVSHAFRGTDMLIHLA